MNVTTLDIVTSQVWRHRVTWRHWWRLHWWRHQSTCHLHFAYWTWTPKSLSFRDIKHQSCRHTSRHTHRHVDWQ